MPADLATPGTQSRPYLNTGSWVVLGSLAPLAVLFVLGPFVSEMFDRLHLIVEIVAAGFCGGGAVNALRGSGWRNKSIGLLGGLWIVALAVAFAIVAFPSW